MKSRKFPAFAKRITYFLYSIRFRLVLWFTGILVIVLAVFSGFIYFNQSRDIQAEAVYRVERKLAALEGTLTITPTGFWMPQGILNDTDVLIVADGKGSVLASRGPVDETDSATLISQARMEYMLHNGGVDSYVTWTQGHHSPNANYIFVCIPIEHTAGLVILGSPLDPTGLYRKLAFNLIAGSLVTLIVALVGGLWLADRAMRPVHTITQAAQEIGETDLSRRLNLKGKDELAELANTFDAMLARLQAAFERQRQFVADASHELRTPLTIVNLETSRVLGTKRSPDEYRQALSVIHSENDYMSGLVNDLLTLARMDAGQTVMEKEPVDLSDVAVETVERLTPLSERNQVRLETGELPEVRVLGDRKYLIQMLVNLVENGIKYTDGAEKCVKVETGVSNGTAWVRVADTGPGIPPEHIPHLFDRFYRVDAARTQNNGGEAASQAPGGSGLGLSIVHWIVQMHAGEILVESTVGRGTTFEARFKAEG